MAPFSLLPPTFSAVFLLINKMFIWPTNEMEQDGRSSRMGTFAIYFIQCKDNTIVGIAFINGPADRPHWGVKLVKRSDKNGPLSATQTTKCPLQEAIVIPKNWRLPNLLALHLHTRKDCVFMPPGILLPLYRLLVWFGTRHLGYISLFYCIWGLYWGLFHANDSTDKR